MKYFSNFPKINYSNTEVIDITRRVKVVDHTKYSPFQFYPYDITTHLRSDQIAEFYYENSYLDWLIYISNEIVDPYYDWYVRDDQLNELIKFKYGSVENAKKRIKYFMNNWFNHADDQLSISHYQNVLAKPLKKYWEPFFSENGDIMLYKRKRIDQTVNTNKIIDFRISYVSGNSYTKEEFVDIFHSANQVGTGEVVFSNSTIVRIQSVQGNTFANSSSQTYIVGETSKANGHATSSNTMTENITNEENAYWTPIYQFDYEIIENEKNRTLKLVDNGIIPFITNEFLNKIKEPQ